MARDFDGMSGTEDETGGLRAALRFVAWGGMAASAIAIAVLAARTDTGSQRLARVLSGPPTAVAASAPAIQVPNPLAARLAEAETESQRLAETVRRLTSDRDRVLARLDAIERNIDVTASIRETPAAPAAAPPPSVAAAPAPAVAASPVAASPPVFTPPIIPPVMANAPPPPAPRPVASSPAPPATAPPAEQTNPGAIPNPAVESTATRTEFGIDVGGDRTVDALRALWGSLRAGRHAALFEGLRPLVAIRESGRPGALDLRLVVGPLANAGAAARLCGSLAAAGLACQPTVFDGQRLALR